VKEFKLDLATSKGYTWDDMRRLAHKVVDYLENLLTSSLPFEG